MSLLIWLAQVEKIECVTRGYRIHVYEDIFAGAMGKELVLLREATNVTSRYEARIHHWTLTKKISNVFLVLLPRGGSMRWKFQMLFGERE